MTAAHIKAIGERLLGIDHIRRIRYATKGIAILPQKITSDEKWMEAFLDIHRLGIEKNKSVVIHTHFSSPREITQWSRDAMNRLFGESVVVRNQAVLQQGVNESPDIMIRMNKKLSYMNIQPYYVYLHDMVPGCEHLRTTLAEAVELEKQVRGSSAGFNTPTFVCDAPGGGGKRHIASWEYYDKENGISIWRAPSVKPKELFIYFDSLHKLSSVANRRWADPVLRENMINHAIHSVDIALTGSELKKIAERLEKAALQK